ncbi:hypothetical protein, partial [Staphylococcus aureus]|uniref:hypothetical protein n=1 Tax=Staphylococcus aureus TaxID=1280 RepID=UPI0038B3343A
VAGSRDETRCSGTRKQCAARALGTEKQQAMIYRWPKRLNTEHGGRFAETRYISGFDLTEGRRDACSKTGPACGHQTQRHEGPG